MHLNLMYSVILTSLPIDKRSRAPRKVALSSPNTLKKQLSPIKKTKFHLTAKYTENSSRLSVDWKESALRDTLEIDAEGC